MNFFDMREVLTQNDFAEMISQDKVLLHFYQDWLKNSVFDGTISFKEADNYFQEVETNFNPNFWLANISDNNSPASFLQDWLKEIAPNLFTMIATGNSSVIWLSFGKYKYGLSECPLTAARIIEKTLEISNL